MRLPAFPFLDFVCSLLCKVALNDSEAHANRFARRRVDYADVLQKLGRAAAPGNDVLCPRPLSRRRADSDTVRFRASVRFALQGATVRGFDAAVGFAQDRAGHRIGAEGGAALEPQVIG